MSTPTSAVPARGWVLFGLLVVASFAGYGLTSANDGPSGPEWKWGGDARSRLECAEKGAMSVITDSRGAKSALRERREQPPEDAAEEIARAFRMSALASQVPESLPASGSEGFVANYETRTVEYRQRGKVVLAIGGPGGGHVCPEFQNANQD